MTFCHNVTVLINMLSGRLEACCLSYGRVATRLNGTKVPTAVLYTSRKEKHASLRLLVIVLQFLFLVLHRRFKFRKELAYNIGRSIELVG